MRHSLVTRIVLSLLAVLLAAALAFAWHHATGVSPTRESDPPARRAPPESFGRYCADCHQAEELAKPLAAAADRTAAVLDMLALLVDHGGADPAEDLEIARWLNGLTGEEAEVRSP